VETDEGKTNHIRLRTYERGVEDETLACGTGVVASSIAYHHRFGKDPEQPSKQHIVVDAEGGVLSVDFEYVPGEGYKNVWLTGPAEMVYEGTIEGS
jgi:diaminopimelate epimerase